MIVSEAVGGAEGRIYGWHAWVTTRLEAVIMCATAWARKMLAGFADGFRAAFTIPCGGAVLASGRAVPGAG